MHAALIRGLRQSLRRGIRDYSSNGKPSLVLGAYEPQEKDGQLILSLAACEFNEGIDGKLEQVLEVAGKKLKAGSSRVLYGLGGGYNAVAIANVGKQDVGFCALDQVDEGRENVRSAIASACKQLRDAGETSIEVDPCAYAEAAAEGSMLALFSYDELKAEDKRKSPVNLTCHTHYVSSDSAQVDTMDKAWKRGTILAEGQNFARRLMEAPSNRMTPSIFCEEVTQQLQGNCTIISRDQSWAESENMGAFLAVAQGSQEPLRFLEIDYSGCPSSLPPVALVGKGITFDSGGISIKPSADMDKMRADMGGAACVAGAILAAAKLRLPINIKGFIALCENMPSGTAIKPGDVVTARSGKTIQIDNTDAEGRLILADTLSYAEESCKPRLIMDVATLTGAVDVALGAGAAAAYTNCNVAWDLLHHAGASTGDRLWRMPLFKLYRNHVTESQLADVNNIGKYSRSAGSCTAAAFLKEFVTNKHWVHLDIAGVMMNKDEVPYLSKGMSGRPTRTIVEFLHRYSKQHHQQT